MSDPKDPFPSPERRFLPAELRVDGWPSVAPWFEKLERRPVDSVESFTQWIRDVSELESLLNADEARRYIAMTCHTDSEESRQRFLDFSKDIDPRAKSAFDRLDRIYLESPFRARLPQPRYAVFDRARASDAEIFCEANLPLETEETELVTRYTQLMGSLMVEIDGEEVPFARARLELEEPDRARREETWRKMAARRYAERETLEELFQAALELRARLAENLGLASYRDLRFKRFRRFDYGVAECEVYHEAVREVVVPVSREIFEERRRRLGLDTLRPWDSDVNVFRSEPFRPFKTEEELCALSRKIFAAVHADFAAEFGALEERGLLDLLSRPNKAQGGYQYFLDDVRMPFIFTNAAGTHDDVQTILHEGGHAFHSLACRDEPLTLYREAPLEFCEVASMGMEFFGLERLDRVYPEQAALQVRCAHLERTLWLLGWIATVDAFQHWVYTAAERDAEARNREWVRLSSRYAIGYDWNGLEEYRRVQWHRQGHIFRQPFYYIEYGIALIGALQLWSHFRRDPEGTVARYRAALALGGSRPLAELFEAAGLRFEFGSAILAPLVEEVRAEWRRLIARTR